MKFILLLFSFFLFTFQLFHSLRPYQFFSVSSFYFSSGTIKKLISHNHIIINYRNNNTCHFYLNFFNNFPNFNNFFFVSLLNIYSYRGQISHINLNFDCSLSWKWFYYNFLRWQINALTLSVKNKDFLFLKIIKILLTLVFLRVNPIFMLIILFSSIVFLLLNFSPLYFFPPINRLFKIFDNFSLLLAICNNVNSRVQKKKFCDLFYLSKISIAIFNYQIFY